MYNILAYIIFRETDKFEDSASSFGPQATRHSSIRESRNILLLFFHNDQIENTQIGIQDAALYRFVLSFGSPPWSATEMPLSQ